MLISDGLGGMSALIIFQKVHIPKWAHSILSPFNFGHIVTISAVGRTQQLDDREKFRSTGYKVVCLDGRTETRNFRQSKRDGLTAENNTQQKLSNYRFYNVRTEH